MIRALPCVLDTEQTAILFHVLHLNKQCIHIPCLQLSTVTAKDQSINQVYFRNNTQIQVIYDHNLFVVVFLGQT